MRSLERLYRNQHDTDPPVQPPWVRHTAYLPPAGVHLAFASSPGKYSPASCMGCKGALSCLQVNSQALTFVNLPLLMYLSNDPSPGGTLGSPPRPRAAPRSQAFAFAAGRAQEAGLVQSKGFAGQQRLALQAGKVLLVPGHPFCLLVVLREDDLQDRQTIAHFHHLAKPEHGRSGGEPAPHLPPSPLATEARLWAQVNKKRHRSVNKKAQDRS